MRRNILLIDDDPDLRDLVSVILGQAGFFVKGVEDGFAGFDELHANRYDLVILDISMPHMNGFKVLRAIRGSHSFANLPVIMLTANAEKDQLIKIRGDIDDYVIKPPNRSDLLSRIERILGGRPQFEEVQFADGDPEADGGFEIAAHLRSVSLTGLSFFVQVAQEKGAPLNGLRFPALTDVKFKISNLRVAECVPLTGGGFQCFASFSGLSSNDQQRVRDWIMARIYKTMKMGGQS